MSYANMVLYGATLPSYRGKADNSGGKSRKPIKADDPANREKVRRIFESFD